MKEEVSIEKIVSLCKRRGFIYPGSLIYGGLSGTYDYGPLGTLLKENIKNIWRKSMTFDHDNIVEIDSAIFLNPKAWEASGHTSGFSDPLVENKVNNKRYRVDHLLKEINIETNENMEVLEIQKLFDENFDKLSISKEKKENFSDVRKFNLLVKSNFGNTNESVIDDAVYLRGETAQGIFVNYKNVLDSTILKIPFGIAQIGKAFRNEIKPKQFVFRMREFEQMEMQYFVHPENIKEEFEKFKNERLNYYIDRLGIPKGKLRLKRHENLVFYAKDAYDIEYQFDFGWQEIEGIHWRGDYDLTQHQNFSGVNMEYLDQNTNEKYIPHVVEVSSGLDRVIFMILENFYREDGVGENVRTLLSLPANIAPIKVSISPLLKNKPELVTRAKDIFKNLKTKFGAVMWDDNGNIGKRYRRQDEIGTPFCIVVDFDTLEDNTVSVRNRDTMKQVRVLIDDLDDFIKDNL